MMFKSNLISQGRLTWSNENVQLAPVSVIFCYFIEVQRKRCELQESNCYHVIVVNSTSSQHHDFHLGLHNNVCVTDSSYYLVKLN